MVGIVVAVALAMTGMGTVLAGHDLSFPVVGRLVSAVGGGAQPGAPHPTRGRTLAGGHSGALELIDDYGDGSKRPRIDTRSQYDAAASESSQRARSDIASASLSECLLCASASAHASAGLGSGVRSGEHDAVGGLLARAWGDAHAAVVHLSGRASVHVGNERTGLAAQVAGEAAVGAQVHGDAQLVLSGHTQHVRVDAGAVVGARARAEEHAALQLAGAALHESGAVEGWAGLGASASVEVKRSGGAITLHHRLGAALGLGGAYEFDVTFDPSAFQLTTRSLDELVHPVAAVGSWLGYHLARRRGTT